MNIDIIITVTERGTAVQIVDHDQDDPIVWEANDLDDFDEAVKLARCALYAERVLAAASPLTNEQRGRLDVILEPVKNRR